MNDTTFTSLARIVADAAAALIARSLGHPPMPRDLTQAQVQHEVNR